MSKYDPLHRFLNNAKPGTQELTLTFAQIESILGSKLPASAHRHRPWWANEYSPTAHTQAKSWLSAGWEVDTVDQAREWVRFRRVA
jgi:hypothetical protein